MSEYQYSDLSAAPSQTYVIDNIATSSMTNKNMTDISFHPKEMWLKIWFDAELSQDDQDVLATIVAAAVTAGASWRRDTGDEYFQLSPSEKKGWILHGGRVKFASPFNDVPSVNILRSEGDAGFDLQVTGVNKECFDYAIRARVKKRGATLSMIKFDWEATL